MTGTDDDDPSSDREPIVEAAAAWIAKLTSEDAADEDRAAFARWHAADPAHAAAYDEMLSLWQRMGEVPDPRRRRKPRPGGLAMVAVAGLALALAAQQFGLVDDWRADIRAGVGGVETATLEDGSRVWLNSDAALTVNFSEGERGVRLLRGEAVFDVAADPARPFIVAASDLRVRVVGTRFYVRADRAADPVGVTAGRVEVLRDDKRIVIGPGEAAHRDETGGLIVTQGDIERRLAWRTGRSIYSGERLADVLADLERYRRGRIVLFDRAAAEMRVSAILDVRNPDEALDGLARTLGLRLTRITPLLVIVRPPG